MASTLIIYQGTGLQTDYTVPFDYLKKSFVTVSLQGSLLTGGDPGDSGADYFFVDKTTVRLKVAPQAGKFLTIRRYTSATERVVTFKDASVLKATDLDTSQLQAFHIAEEARDIINDALIQDKFDKWDAKNHRIVNVADPVDPQDAVTYKVYKEDAQGAYQARLGAQRAQSASQAARDASNASAELAKKWATQEATPVQGSLYSSKYYAESASTSAKVAGDSQTQAKESQKNAQAQAADAKASASTATTKASEASQSATAASQSASSASTSASAAKASQTNSKASQTNAKTSETNAKASETKAGQILAQVTTEGQAQVQAVKDQGTTSVGLVTAEGTKQVQSVATEGTAQVNLAKAQVTKATSQADRAKSQADRAKQYADDASKGQVQSDWTQTDSADAAFIKNKPVLATVATSGSYNDLTDKPVIPDPTWDNVQNKPSTFPPSSHTHPTTQITGLDDALDGKLGKTEKAASAVVADSANAVAWEGVTGKPTIPATPNAYITQTWKAGSIWYRVWSDGFIEQGGLKQTGSQSWSTHTISLSKAFSTTNYVVNVMPVADSASARGFVVKPSKTTTSFSVVANPSTTANLFWISHGY